MLSEATLRADPNIIEQNSGGAKAYFLRHKWGSLPHALRVVYPDQIFQLSASDIFIRSAFDRLFYYIEGVSILSNCSWFEKTVGSAPLDGDIANYQTKWWIRLMCEIEERFNSRFFFEEYAKAWGFASVASLFTQVRETPPISGYHNLPVNCGRLTTSLTNRQASIELGDVPFGWASSTRNAKEYVDFFLRNTDTTFISFGEIINGRADAPDRWSDHLAEVLTEEVETALNHAGASEEHMRIFEARDKADTLLGYALVSIDKLSNRPNAWLQDVIVGNHLRGLGLGARIVEAVESELRKDTALQEVFLESSTRKADAHRFFHRLGYEEAAVVMMKSLC